MIRGKFLAQDDFDLAGHRLFNWKWLNDIPHEDAEDGQTIALVDGEVTWATLSASGIVSVAWDDITGKPSEFTPESHQHDFASDITGKPTFVNSIVAGTNVTASTSVGDVTISVPGVITDHGSLSGLSDADHPLTALQQGAASAGNGIILVGTTWTATNLTVDNITGWATAALSVASVTASTVDASTLTVSGTATAGTLRSNGNIYLNHDGPEGNSGLYFYEGGSPTGAAILWDDGDARLETTQGLYVGGILEIGSQLRVRPNSAYIGYAGNAGNKYLYFYEGGPTGQYLMWDDTNNNFDFDAALVVNGQVDATTIVCSGNAYFDFSAGNGGGRFNSGQRGWSFDIQNIAGGWARGYYFHDNTTVLGGFYGFGGTGTIRRMGISSEYNIEHGVHVDYDNTRVGINTTTPDQDVEIVGTTILLTGNTTASTNLTVGSKLAVTGGATFTGNVSTTTNLDVGGDLTVTGGVTVTGNVSLTTNLDVGGELVITGDVSAVTDMTVGGDLTVDGDLIYNSTAVPNLSDRTVVAQSLASSTILQSSGLAVNVVSHGAYVLDCVLVVDGTNTSSPDVKLGWLGPTGREMSWCTGVGTGVTVSTYGDTNSLAVNGTTATMYHLTGLLTVASTAGQLELYWAQTTSSANAIRMLPISQMTLRRT